MSCQPTKHRPAEEILRAVAEGTATSTGEDFFRSLAQHLATALDLRYCFVTERLDLPPTRVATLAFWGGEGVMGRFEYDLAGTPCESVLAGEACVYSRNLQALFPDDRDLEGLDAESYAAVPVQDSGGRVIGHLAVLDVAPFDPDSLDLSILKIFASRAGAELERQRPTARVEGSGQTLRRSEARLRQVIDLVPHFIFAKDREGRFILVNRAVAEVYGTTVEDLLGRKDADFARSEDEVRQFRADDLKVIDSGRQKFIPEEQITDSAGRVRFLQTTKIPFTCANSDLPSILGVAIDITERKRAEAERRKIDLQLRQTQKLESLGVLAGGIAHDFNNLLVGMLGNAGLALAKLPADSPGRSNIEGIALASQRAAELSNQMLAYSGRGRFVIEQIDLKILVEDMVDLLRASVTKKAALRLDLRSDLPSIEADITEIRQVVMNLITNAADALGDGEGVISLNADEVDADRSYLAKTYLDDGLPAGRYVALEVADSGCGMDAETREKIFDPFFTTKFSGRGLGLAAVLGIVRGHGGAIDVESEPGRGTNIRVLFPAGQARREEESPAEEKIAIRGDGRTILVVDDDPAICLVAREILKDSGFRVLIAEDGLAALESVRRYRQEIAAVLLDMTMPHLDGVETLRALHRRQPDIKVVLTSGYSEQEASRRLAGEQPAAFIQKPYLPDELVRIMTAVLGVAETQGVLTASESM